MSCSPLDPLSRSPLDYTALIIWISIARTTSKEKAMTSLAKSIKFAFSCTCLVAVAGESIDCDALFTGGKIIGENKLGMIVRESISLPSFVKSVHHHCMGISHH